MRHVRKSNRKKGVNKKPSGTQRNPQHVIVDQMDNERTQVDVQFPLAGAFSNQVYNIVQAYDAGTVFTTSVTVPTFAALNFTLNSLDQVSSLTAVFDQYRIRCVEARFIPIAYSGTAGVNIPLSTGKTTSVLDYDDSSVLTTYAAALDYQNEMTTETGMPFTRTIRPHIATAGYSGAFTSFINDDAQWIDAAYPSVQHYGIKVANTVSVVTVAYSAIIRMWIQFRNVR